MATSPILTYGFGSFGSVNKVPTLGFVSATEDPATQAYCVAASQAYVAGAVAGEGYEAGTVAGEGC